MELFLYVLSFFCGAWAYSVFVNCQIKRAFDEVEKWRVNEAKGNCKDSALSSLARELNAQETDPNLAAKCEAMYQAVVEAEAGYSRMSDVTATPSAGSHVSQ